MTVASPMIVVAGGGFAGLRLIESLRARDADLGITLIDPRAEAVFLPLLPDVVAGKVRDRRLLYPLSKFCADRRVELVCGRAAKLEGERAVILEGDRKVPFDYLAVCCGAEPDFHGNEDAHRLAYTLYSARDALRLRERVKAVAAAGRPHTFIVIGGGYTGLETATALGYLLARLIRSGTISPFFIRVVELAPKVLGGLPESIADPVRREVDHLGIRLSVSATIGDMNEKFVEIDGERVTDFTLIWSAGVRVVDFVRSIEADKDKQGRLVVDPDLRLPSSRNIYALGDCAHFEAGGGPLRMAVQFSWAQGPVAAENILRQIGGREPHAYKPRDFGYLVPLASWRAWGKVGGATVGGMVGSFFHYFMCIFRTKRCRNKIGIVWDLVSVRRRVGSKLL